MKWTQKSNKTLKNLINNNYTKKEISDIMGITIRSIDCQCYRLKIKIKKNYRAEIKCLNCGNTFISLISENRKFCSHRCNAIYYNHRRIITEETKIKISNSLKNNTNNKKLKKNNCLNCGKEVKKIHNIFCSRECRCKSEIVKDKIRKKMIERYKNFPEQHPNIRCANILETYPEKFFKNFLITNGLIENKNFFPQYPIEKYFVDFYFPNINTCVEIDGERWHNKNDAKEKSREIVIKKYSNIIRFDVKPLLKKKYENEIINLIYKIKNIHQIN